MRLALAVLAIAGSLVAPSHARAGDEPAMLVIVGAAGETEFAGGFEAAAGALQEAGRQAGIPCQIAGLDTAEPEPFDDRGRIEAWIRAQARSVTQPVWIIYLGHGTWDGREARLNLRGPDLSASELAGWLDGFDRPLVFVHGGSASGPFIPALAGPGRVVITATESGDEVNYARFGGYFAAALAGRGADIDRDGRTSLLEAFVHAAQEVRLFYEESGRMQTEHALIEDSGDGRGTPAAWFRGTRVEQESEDPASPDGALAHRLALLESPDERLLTDEQRSRRDALERELEGLRARKSSMEIEDYLRELETILRALSAIYLAAPEPADSNT